MSNIGNIIKDKRLSQNLSLDELGELINVGKSTMGKRNDNRLKII